MRAGSPTGLDALVPCTPLGCLHLLKHELGSLAGLDAVVIGRSNIVGKPMAQLLLGESATVTIAHSRTRDLPDVVRRADIVVAAVGRAGNGPRRLDQAGRDRDRRRHQPRRRPMTARAGWSATSRSTKPPKSPPRSRRCPAASGR